MASAVDSRLAYARLSAVATASRLPTANRGSNNSYTTSWDTTNLYVLIVLDSLDKCTRGAGGSPYPDMLLEGVQRALSCMDAPGVARENLT